MAGVMVDGDLLVDVGELGVAVRVLAALDGLDIGLQAEALVTQQVGDSVRADAVALARSARWPGRGSRAVRK
ncbi:hypothetical protein GCM10009828_076440 [Actinoplanes couchii]|uniref:Uncharacterized protein n=1 Tax=Actinoplanes couchii TaxID=403638 RepID=A0ABQ3WZT3_9ACTN|nr:hypothetical protein Aco03nite_000520 [Actinoplanes couchii]